MDLLSNLALGFSVALTPTTLALAVAGCILGTMIGTHRTRNSKGTSCHEDPAAGEAPI